MASPSFAGAGPLGTTSNNPAQFKALTSPAHVNAFEWVPQVVPVVRILCLSFERVKALLKICAVSMVESTHAKVRYKDADFGLLNDLYQDGFMFVESDASDIQKQQESKRLTKSLVKGFVERARKSAGEVQNYLELVHDLAQGSLENLKVLAADARKSAGDFANRTRVLTRPFVWAKETSEFALDVAATLCPAAKPIALGEKVIVSFVENWSEGSGAVAWGVVKEKGSDRLEDLAGDVARKVAKKYAGKAAGAIAESTVGFFFLGVSLGEHTNALAEFERQATE